MKMNSSSHFFRFSGLQFDVFGDAVNVAARLSDFVEMEGQIVISEELRDSISSNDYAGFPIKPLGDCFIKG